VLDAAFEKSKGDFKIGSTLRGIGPTYQDKMARIGLRLGDVNAKDFDQRYQALKDRHCETLDRLEYDYDLSDQEAAFFKAIEVLRSYRIVNTEYLINDLLVKGRSILAEGAQGSLLDIDFGSYPYVTSSNTISAGACTGLGISPRHVGEVFGIFKAYCTRVGSGPFPTELSGAKGDKLRQQGNEFGATTGRPRRCGWLDIPALKYATMLNGVTQLFMMKVDILSDIGEINLCDSYSHQGQDTEEFPVDFNEDWSVNLKAFKSWSHHAFNSYSQFPDELKAYISYIEQRTDVPINLISIGPDRESTILK
jgi:adenylosuccinate synthase